MLARRRLRIGSVLALAVATWSSTACSTGPSIVDHVKLEHGIVDQSTSAQFPIATVSCPDDRKLAEGDTFTCQATLTTGESVTIDATQSDGDGTVTWVRHEAMFLGADFARIEDGALSQEYGRTITLACPERVVVNDGDSFTCDGTDDRGHVRTVTFIAVHARDGEFTHVVDGLPSPSTTVTTTP